MWGLETTGDGLYTLTGLLPGDAIPILIGIRKARLLARSRGDAPEEHCRNRRNGCVLISTPIGLAFLLQCYLFQAEQTTILLCLREELMSHPILAPTRVG